MYDPLNIAHEIATREAQIEQLHREIEELRYSPISNEEGEIVSYADWAA